MTAKTSLRNSITATFQNDDPFEYCCEHAWELPLVPSCRNTTCDHILEKFCQNNLQCHSNCNGDNELAVACDAECRQCNVNCNSQCGYVAQYCEGSEGNCGNTCC